MAVLLYSKHGIQSSIVDDIDSDLSVYSWGLSGKKGSKYVYRKDNKEKYYIHRLIAERMIGRELRKGEEVDHENGYTTDNRRHNLRVVNRSQNMANTKLRVTNTSGYKGVRRNGKRWMAGITHNYKSIHLGTFDTPEQAHEVYCEKARELFGEFFNAG